MIPTPRIEGLRCHLTYAKFRLPNLVDGPQSRTSTMSTVVPGKIVISEVSVTETQWPVRFKPIRIKRPHAVHWLNIIGLHTLRNRDQLPLVSRWIFHICTDDRRWQQWTWSSQTHSIQCILLGYHSCSKLKTTIQSEVRILDPQVTLPGDDY